MGSDPAWPRQTPVVKADSQTVVAVNHNRTARIFEHADLGVTADAEEIIDALLGLA